MYLLNLWMYSSSTFMYSSDTKNILRKEAQATAGLYLTSINHHMLMQSHGITNWFCMHYASFQIYDQYYKFKLGVYFVTDEITRPKGNKSSIGQKINKIISGTWNIIDWNLEHHLNASNRPSRKCIQDSEKRHS